MAKVPFTTPGGITDIIEFTFEDLQRTGFLTSSIRQIANVPIGSMCDLCVVRVITAPSAALRIHIGQDATDPDGMVDNLATAANLVYAKTISDFSMTAAASGTWSAQTAVPIRMKVTEFGGGTDMSGLTSGKIRIGLRIIEI